MSNKIWKFTQSSKHWKPKFNRHVVNNLTEEFCPISKTPRYGNHTIWPEYRGYWIENKYINGLLKKFIGKPIKDLEDAYYKRLKEYCKVKNPPSFLDAFKWHINGLGKRHRHYCEYSIKNGVLVKMKIPTRKYYIHFNQKDIDYNNKNIEFFGSVRCIPIIDGHNDDWYPQEFLKPVFLGNLICIVNHKKCKLPVYNYYPACLQKFQSGKDKSFALQSKVSNFYKEWTPVNIGIIFQHCYTDNGDDLGLGRLHPVVKNNELL